MRWHHLVHLCEKKFSLFGDTVKGWSEPNLLNAATCENGSFEDQALSLANSCWDGARFIHERSEETTIPICKYKNLWRSTWIRVEVKVGEKFEGVVEKQVDEAIDAFRPETWL